MNTSVSATPVTDPYESLLQQAAALWGIQPDYWDIFGVHHETAPEAQKAILTSFGVRCGSIGELEVAIEDRLSEEWGRPTPATLVLGVKEAAIPVSIPANLLHSTLTAELEWEEGGGLRLECVVADLEAGEEVTIRGEKFERRELKLPANVPLGYHRLAIRIEGGQGSATSSTRLVLCPERAYQPPYLDRGGKAGGIAVSLYGLRSDRNWGCGDFTDLESLIDWVADERVGDFVGLNPLHALANRSPYNTSPYLPICSFYRNPLYVDVGRVEDVTASSMCLKLLNGPKVSTAVAELRASQHVEYERVWRLKLVTLKAAFREFHASEYSRNTERAQRFKDFVAAEGVLLDRYAVYSALDETMHKRNRNVWVWPDWPADYHDPDSEATRQFARDNRRLILFYKYLQWIVDEQLARAQQRALDRGLRIGLYHDLALATDRFGSDLWAHRSYYVAGCRVGSPPDGFAPEGQDWAFPPPNSLCHHQNGYELFAESIRKNAKHGGALRIDHVMRFFRLFWIPDGLPAKLGTYVKDFAEDLLHILALESVRNKFMVVGEDLGTVEPSIREDLQRFGVLGYRLLYFEKNQQSQFKRPAEYTRQALVSATTHDLPTLAGFWAGADIEARRQAGMTPTDDLYYEQLEQREKEKQQLLDLFHQLTLLPPYFPRYVSHVTEFTGELHNAVVGFLALTPSELMVLNQEDLFKDPEQQNLPGTTAQYPNWRHKMRFTLEEMRTNPFARDCAAMLRDWLENTGRVNP